MAEVGSYIYIAMQDLQRAKIMYDVDDYSASGRFCEQVVEKCFKSYIEAKGGASDYRLMLLHKPLRLYERCLQLGFKKMSDADVSVLSKLADYYYDTNYPGNSYFELTKAHADEAVALAEKVVEMFVQPGE